MKLPWSFSVRISAFLWIAHSITTATSEIIIKVFSLSRNWCAAIEPFEICPNCSFVCEAGYFILSNCRRAQRISKKRGCPAVLDVPIRPPCFCVPIVIGPNPSMFSQITIPNLDITMPALYLKWMKWCQVIKAMALEQLYHLAVHQWHHFLLRTLFGHRSVLRRTSWSPVVNLKRIWKLYQTWIWTLAFFFHEFHKAAFQFQNSGLLC